MEPKQTVELVFAILLMIAKVMMLGLIAWISYVVIDTNDRVREIQKKLDQKEPK